MNPPPLLGKQIDWVTLSWVLLWNLCFSIGISVMLNAYPEKDIPESMQPALGICIGGFSAGSAMLGTWAILIHLPSSTGSKRQRIQPRVVAMSWCLIHLLIVAIFSRNAPTVLGQIFLTVAMSWTGILIASLWTHRRISCGSTAVPSQRSIAQIMQITLTFAIAIAAVNLVHRVLNVPTSVVLLVSFSALMWILLVIALLGRWWGSAIATLPLMMIQVIGVSTFVDTLDRNSQAMVLQLNSMSVGFYLGSIVFLTLLRSSGHRFNVAT